MPHLRRCLCGTWVVATHVGIFRIARLSSWTWGLLALMIVQALFYAWWCAPGASTPDTINQLHEGQAWSFTNAHPVAMSVVLGFLFDVFGSTTPILVIQLLSAALAFWWAHHDRQTRAGQWLALFFGAAPIIWAQWTALWKDVWCAQLFLLSVVAALRGRFVWALWLAVMASAFRHNAVVLVPFVAVAAALQWLQSQQAHNHHRARMWAVCGVGLAVVGAVAWPRMIERLVHATDTHPAVYTMQYDVVGASVFDEQALVTGPYHADYSYEDYVLAYSPQHARKLRHGRFDVGGLALDHLMTDDGAAVLTREWRRVLRDHTGGYLRHRWHFARLYYGFDFDEQFDAAPSSGKMAERAGLEMPSNTIDQRMLAQWRFVVVRPMSWALPWHLGMFVMLGLALRLRSWACVWLAAGAIVFEAATMITAPVVSFRYHLPGIVVLMAVSPLLIERWQLRKANDAGDASSSAV
jgi:hypothetical protein